MIIQLKDEFKRISTLVGATFSSRSHSEMQQFTQDHDFTTPIINLLPVEDINQNIMVSGAVRYDFKFHLYFLTTFPKSDTLEANKDILLDTMIALSEAFYRELNKNDALLFINPRWTWKNNLTRQYLSNLTLGCVTDVFIDTSCARSPSPIPLPPPPESFDALVALIGRGYNYPQPTGQTTIFRTGDDADIEATIFAPIREANSLRAQNSLANFTTLNNNNEFGNTDRFTDTEGLQDYGATGGALVDYVVDNFTGLAWDQFTRGNNLIWDDQIDFYLASTFNGFSDWFMPSWNQYTSVTLKGSAIHLVVPPFDKSAGVTLWISTTDANLTTNAWHATNTNPGLLLRAKTSVRANTWLCRKHF